MLGEVSLLTVIGLLKIVKFLEGSLSQSKYLLTISDVTLSSIEKFGKINQQFVVLFPTFALWFLVPFHNKRKLTRSAIPSGREPLALTAEKNLRAHLLLD
jgi:hypothetical protein